MTKSTETCPICGQGQLTNAVRMNSVGHNGHAGEIEMEYSVCDVCGCEQADPAQLRNNKRRMVEFKKRALGLLTGAELREIRERLRLTQSEAAAAFGGGPVAFSKYENDDVIQAESMDKLLRLIDRVPEARYDLLGYPAHTNFGAQVQVRVSFNNTFNCWQNWDDLRGHGHHEVRRVQGQHLRVIKSVVDEEPGQYKLNVANNYYCEQVVSAL